MTKTIHKIASTIRREREREREKRERKEREKREREKKEREKPELEVWSFLKRKKLSFSDKKELKKNFLSQRFR